MQYRTSAKTTKDSIRVDEFGSPDVEYYRRKAHQLRAQAIADMGHQFKGWISQALRKFHHPTVGSAIKH